MTQQRTLGQDSVSRGLIKALASDEVELHQTAVALARAQSAYDVASRRYAAMREAVRERLGSSPYASNVQWLKRHESFGFYRYVRMKVGDAAVEALEESKEPLNLGAIRAALVIGGLHVRDERAINAALINTKGVTKDAEGRYQYQEPAASENNRLAEIFKRLDDQTRELTSQ